MFGNLIENKINLLPKDGIVNYYGKIFKHQESDYYFERLLNNIEWKNEQVIIYGKHIITKRKAAFYGDNDNFVYTYSHIPKKALIWTEELLELKLILQKITGEQFNVCLLNLYNNGNEGMSWHSDNEKELKKNGAIASISFGADRKFIFRHRESKEKVSLMLEDGSLLLMKGITQQKWLHSLPITKKIIKPRINLTFRTINI